MVTSSSEKRLSQRYSTSDVTDNNGRFHILVDDQPHEITDIHDVSITGVRILMETPLLEGSSLMLSYFANDLNMSIEAEIAWCELDDESGLFLTGIKFSPLQPDLSTLFFLAFRKQLDHFDQDRHLLQS